MTSARDLLEAHAFERRRLVRAVFSSGGLEGGSPSPARALVAGAVLAALLVAASVLTGVTRPDHAPAGTSVSVRPPR